MAGLPLLGLFLALAAPTALGQTEADALYEKGLYQQALQVYEKQQGFRAFFRAQESKGLLQRYAESAQSLFDAPVPAPENEHALLLLLRTQIAREYLKHSGGFLPKDSERGARDVTKWTQSEWHSKVAEDYFTLHSLRQVLVREPIESAGYFIRVLEADTELVPTVWDFAVIQWTDYLATLSGGGAYPDADQWIQKDFGSAVESSLPTHDLVAAIWDEAASLEGGTNRTLAREYARWRRVYPPWAKGAKSPRSAGKLVALFESFRNSRARALAGTSAAEIFWRGKDEQKALSLCEKVAEIGPTNGCKEIQESILAPELEIESFPTPSLSKTRARVKSRNLAALHFRLYATTKEQLRTLQPSDDWSFLRTLNHETAAQFLEQKPIHTTSVIPQPIRPYEMTELPLSLPPALPEGFYVLLVAEDAPFKKLLRGAVLNVTDLVLFADRPLDTSRARTALSLRVFSGKTGLPEEGAEVTLRSPKGGQSATSSKEGRAEFHPAENQADLLVQKNKDVALLPHPLWLSFADRRPALSMHLDTDRAIYRPGQIVRSRLTVFRALGTEYSLARDTQIVLSASDANGKVFFKKKIKLTQKLSAAFQFVLPQGALLGQFTVSAEGKELATGTQGSASRTIRVEEYVRPDFEVKLEDTKSLNPNATVSVAGTALTYTGGAQKDQPITFRVSREEYWPRHFARGLSPHEPGERSFVSQGTSYTNSRGEFEIHFPTALPSNVKEVPCRFIVEATATGPSGKTVQTSQTYFAKHAALHARLAKGFFNEGEAIGLTVDALTGGADKTQVKGTMTIHALEDSGEAPDDFSANDSERAFSELPAGKQVLARQFDTSKMDFSLPALPAGIYRLSVEAAGAVGETSHFIVWSKALPLRAAATADKRTYRPGETASVIVGSSDLKGKMVVEVWKGEERLSTSLFEGGVRVHALPILPSYRGDIVLRWFGVYNHRHRQGQAAIEVEWADRKLVLQVDAPMLVKPGTRSRWALRLVDPNGKLVDAEGLLSVYDGSLDAYAPPETPWVESLYGANFRPALGERSYAKASFAWLAGPVRGSFPEEARFPPLPKLRVETDPFVRHYSRATPLSGRFAPMATASMEINRAAALEPLRTDFRETAYFSPQLYFKKGIAFAEFTFPDSLTRWSIRAFAIDSGFRVASLKTQTISRQDFSVSLSGPRFLREEDKASLTAVVANQSAKALTGKTTLRVEFSSGKRIPTEAKTFRLLPGQTSPLHFSFSVPAGEREARATITSAAGSFQDGEAKRFQVLPNRHRLIASKVVALVPGQKTPIELKVPAGAVLESTTLQVDPELASVLVQAIPLLASQTQKDSPSVADRLVSLGWLQSFSATYPGTARRTTQTKAWAKNDPRLGPRVEETPWVSEAEGSGQAVSLSKEETSALLKTVALELESLQTPRGGFPWFKGGREDFSTTLHVLGRLSEAKRSGLTLSKIAVEKAAPYLRQEIAAAFTPSEENLANRLFAAHVINVLYPQEEWKAFTEETLSLAQKHFDLLAPYAKGLAADSAFRTGKTELGEDFLEKALDGARENTWGLFWAPEKVSWHWYNDSLDKHAFFLRLLLDWKSEDTRVHGLAKWLTLNRKTSVWKSTRNSASAVSALLEYQKKRGILSEPLGFEVAWAGRKINVPAKALLWTKRPALPSSLKASVLQNGEGIGFASLTSPYTSARGMEGNSGLLAVRANYFIRKAAADGNGILAEITSGAQVAVGTEVEVVYTLAAESPLGYVGIRAPRAAGLEPTDKLSQWLYTPLIYYRELRDSVDSFFLPEVPQGEVLLRTRFFAEQPGLYQFGPVTAQSVYSPDITATAPGFSLGVVPRG